VSSLSIAGLDFAITSNTCLAAPVAIGGSCTVSVSFTPQAVGARSSSLVITDNAPGSPQSVPLTGTGVAPPAAASFIFGNQAVAAKADSNPAGRAEAFKVTTASTGSVTQLRVFVDAGSTATSLVAALYSNNAGHPGTLMVSGNLAAPVAGAFNTVTVTGPTPGVTAGQTYWIAILGPAGTLRFRDQGAVGAGSSEASASATLAGMPATWASGASFTDGNLSAWAAGTVTATPPPPPPPTGLSPIVGNAATEAQADNNAAGRAEAFLTTASTTGSVQALRVFIDTANTATSVQVGLYTNNAGHPGTLLTSGTLSAPTAGANNSVTVPAVAVTAGQTYWIALLTPSGTGQIVRFRDRAQPTAALGQSEWSSSAVLTALPNTWVNGTQFRDGFLSAVGLG
jgi:hypothetical protein